MNRLFLFLPLALGAVGTLQEQAQALPTGEPSLEASLAFADKFTGQITKIEASKSVLFMKVKPGKSVMVKATDKTKVVIGGQVATFADLAVGDKLFVEGKLDKQKNNKKKKVVVASLIKAK